MIDLQTPLNSDIEDHFPSKVILVRPIFEEYLPGRPIKCHFHKFRSFQR